jgi:asparaginyl-tRNA synthetase
MEYTEAIAHLEKAQDTKKFEFPVQWGSDLQSEHERYLAEELVGRPVVVMNYPKDIKAFYMRLNDDGKTVAAMDVLAPGIGEIIGGSQREERLDVLDQRIDEMGLPAETTGGTATCVGTARCPTPASAWASIALVQYVTGMANIRDVIPFPRTRRNAEF